MTLEQFDQLLMAEFEKFKACWLEHEDWPDDMEEEEWIEQFIVWLQKDI